MSFSLYSSLLFRHLQLLDYNFDVGDLYPIIILRIDEGQSRGTQKLKLIKFLHRFARLLCLYLNF